MDEHGQGRDKLPYHYNPYFGTTLSTILDTYITARKNWYRLIMNNLGTIIKDKYTVFLHLKPYAHVWEFNQRPNYPLHLIHNIKLNTLHTMVESPFKRRQ